VIRGHAGKRDDGNGEALGESAGARRRTFPRDVRCERKKDGRRETAVSSPTPPTWQDRRSLFAS